MENNKKEGNDFKINAYFSDEGEELENLLAFYIGKLFIPKTICT